MVRRAALLLCLALLAALLVGLNSRWLIWRGLPPTPEAPGPEGCLHCHGQAGADPGGAHAAARMGCTPCHLGDARAVDKVAAHSGLERQPGALATVEQTCGRCHPAESARVQGSLMASGRGLIAVDRWAFGELDRPDGDQTMQALLAIKHPTPAQDHLRKLCSGCHLGTRRENRDSAVTVGGSGCAACHSSVSRGVGHTPVDSRVSSDRCFGCHSRSARISLSYQGWAEAAGAATTLPDGRKAQRLSPDVHQAAGISCIDCHLHTETMGDGQAWRHQEQQVEIACASCHPPADERTLQTWAGQRDPITLTMLRLRGQTRPPGEAVRSGRRGTPLWNLRPAGAAWALQPKSGPPNKTWLARSMPVDANHRLAGHERLTCQACHSAWAPRCEQCHTSYDPKGRQWDFAAAGVRPGAWVEERTRAAAGRPWGPPTLGINAAGKVAPAVPGMIMQLDIQGARIQRRLFASLDPHTTARRGRTCADCHRSPLALGLGRGRLDFGPGGVTFVARGPTQQGVAAGGWTSLFPVTPGASTRVGARSLNALEQRRILRVGACLPCHSRVEDRIYRDFRQSLQRLRQDRRGCRAPRRLP